MSPKWLDRKTDGSPISPHLTLPFVHALSPLPAPLPKGFGIEDVVVNVDVGLVMTTERYVTKVEERTGVHCG
jgi:hypothetical protein